MNGNGQDDKKQLTLREVIDQAENDFGIPKGLLHALTENESSYGANTESPTGPRGPLQFTTATAKRMGMTDKADPIQNAIGGAKYLRENYERFKSLIKDDKERWLAAAVAHNRGEGAVMQTMIKDGRFVPEGIDSGNGGSTPQYAGLLAERWYKYNTSAKAGQAPQAQTPLVQKPKIPVPTVPGPTVKGTQTLKAPVVPPMPVPHTSTPFNATPDLTTAPPIIRGRGVVSPQEADINAQWETYVQTLGRAPTQQDVDEFNNLHKQAKPPNVFKTKDGRTFAQSDNQEGVKPGQIRFRDLTNDKGGQIIVNDLGGGKYQLPQVKENQFTTPSIPGKKPIVQPKGGFNINEIALTNGPKIKRSQNQENVPDGQYRFESPDGETWLADPKINKVYEESALSTVDTIPIKLVAKTDRSRVQPALAKEMYIEQVANYRLDSPGSSRIYRYFYH